MKIEDIPARFASAKAKWRERLSVWWMNLALLGMAAGLSMVFGIAGSGLYTFGLLWSMYGVMDRY